MYKQEVRKRKYKLFGKIIRKEEMLNAENGDK
jgi:hypothetical protein